MLEENRYDFKFTKSSLGERLLVGEVMNACRLFRARIILS